MSKVAKVKKKLLDMFKLVDETDYNYNYYKNKFDNMSDSQFINYFKTTKFPLRIHVENPLSNAINMDSVNKALEFMEIPAYERVNISYQFDGNDVWSEKCLVGYVHIQKMQQMNEKKHKHGYDISKVDAKTNKLISDSKVVDMTDRELESALYNNLNETTREFYGFRGDDTYNFNLAMSKINATGELEMGDLEEEVNSEAKNTFKAFMIACQMMPSDKNKS